MVKRCLNTDMKYCQKNPTNPCCGQYMVNRFFPIGPNIQPTLTENWVSALFEFAGQDPIAFVWIKTAFIATIVGTLILGWCLLGHYLGQSIHNYIRPCRRDPYI